MYLLAIDLYKFVFNALRKNYEEDWGGLLKHHLINVIYIWCRIKISTGVNQEQWEMTDINVYQVFLDWLINWHIILSNEY